MWQREFQNDVLAFFVNRAYWRAKMSGSFRRQPQGSCSVILRTTRSGARNR